MGGRPAVTEDVGSRRRPRLRPSAVDFRAPMTRCENDGAPPLSVGQAVAATHGERRAAGEAVDRGAWLSSDRRKRPRGRRPAGRQAPSGLNGSA